jgi:purine-binding chemotaxis protein CheW
MCARANNIGEQPAEKTQDPAPIVQPAQRVTKSALKKKSTKKTVQRSPESASVTQVVSAPDDNVVPMEQLVTFELDREEYASAIVDLREIIPILDITPIPGAPAFVRGIVNIRGQIVVVIDLEQRFALSRTHDIAPRHIIVAEVGESVFGILVDVVSGVIRVPKASIQPTPKLISTKIHAEYLKGVVITEEVQQEEEVVVPEEGVKAVRAKNKKKAETPTHLILLLDIPKLLSEKELLEFGSMVKNEGIKENV